MPSLKSVPMVMDSEEDMHNMCWPSEYVVLRGLVVA